MGNGHYGSPLLFGFISVKLICEKRSGKTVGRVIENSGKVLAERLPGADTLLF